VDFLVLKRASERVRTQFSLTIRDEPSRECSILYTYVVVQGEVTRDTSSGHVEGEVIFLEEIELPWQGLMEAMPDGAAIIDRQGVMHNVNAVLSKMTGYSREELVGQHVQILIPPRLRDVEGEARREYVDDPANRIIWSNRDIFVMRKDGSELSVDFALSPITVDGSLWAIGSIRDNSLQRRAERARADAENHFRLAFEDNMAPMVLTDLDDRAIAVNSAFLTLVGRSRAEIIGCDSKLFTYPDDVGVSEDSHNRILRSDVGHLRYVKRYLHKDGRVIIVEISKTSARDETGKTIYFIVSQRDITEERNLTAQLSHQALHDPMTGLANRALFADRLAQAKARTVRQGGKNALFLIDLDNFKLVNDTYGHLVGDDVLVEVARRLDGASRSSDTLCRFGGDEFLYLAEDIAGGAEMELIAARLLDVIARPINIDRLTIGQRASLGAVMWDAHSIDDVDVVLDADVALYEAKRLGKARYVVHVPGMRQHSVAEQSFADQLRHALAAGELSMHYQPIVQMTNGRVVGFEALMRWRHPERGWVPPDVFIALAEQSDLIMDIGAFALHEAISMATTWKSPGASMIDPYVTVNLSARQFHDPELVTLIVRELERWELPGDRLIIEITESVALLEISDTLTMIERLRTLGIGVALDDFGTGFSSLAYLARLNPIIIKIDQSFVRSSAESLHDDRLLETIVSLGNNLGMTVLAEGIETMAQLKQLQDYSCTLGQGFFFSSAVPGSETARLVEHTYQV
jgi:diguanylate cyclase (GGDEF)-like protein/PAS domain S-box-containing protein